MNRPLEAWRLNMSRGAFYAFVALLIGLTFALGTLALVWQDNRSLKEKVAASDSARLAEKRAAVTAAYGRCLLAIKSTKQANKVIAAIRQNILDQAESSDALSRLDSDPALRERWRKIAADRRFDASTVVDFPTITRAQCDRQRKSDLSQAGVG